MNLRAGQDSGYFFLQPTLDALTYAGDIGVDVVNMSYYVDPWLFNCIGQPGRLPGGAGRAAGHRDATQRALDYARSHGVLPIAAAGNESHRPRPPGDRRHQPGLPGRHRERAHDRQLVPQRAGREQRRRRRSARPARPGKAYYSNYGIEQTDIAAPGGDSYDSPDNTLGHPRPRCSPRYPKNVAEAKGDLNPDGTPTHRSSCRTARAASAAYYQYLQGTSMAAPHAVGVAALVVSQYGKADRKHGGLTLDPSMTQRILENTAVEHPCPTPRTFSWHRVRSTAPFTVDNSATCAGPVANNGFYGNGIVNAYAAVTK